MYFLFIDWLMNVYNTWNRLFHQYHGHSLLIPSFVFGSTSCIEHSCTDQLPHLHFRSWASQLTHSSLHQCSQQKMNVKNLHYSLKNIPIPKDNAYLKCLIDKTSNFIRRIRWKAFFYEKRLTEQNQSEDLDNNHRH